MRNPLIAQSLNRTALMGILSNYFPIMVFNSPNWLVAFIFISKGISNG